MENGKMENEKMEYGNNRSNRPQRKSPRGGKCHPYRIGRIIAAVLGGVVLAVLFAFLFGIAVMALWNWLMPVIFGLDTITYWQAFGLVILAKLLFGGFGGGGHGDKDDHKHGKSSKCKDWFMKKDDSHDDYSHEDHSREEPYNGEPYDCSNQSQKHGRLYERYWEEEGKEAFDAYVRKIETQDAQKNTDQQET